MILCQTFNGLKRHFEDLKIAVQFRTNIFNTSNASNVEKKKILFFSVPKTFWQTHSLSFPPPLSLFLTSQTIFLCLSFSLSFSLFHLSLFHDHFYFSYLSFSYFYLSPQAHSLFPPVNFINVLWAHFWYESAFLPKCN